METIVNKVAESGLIVLNLEDYLPKSACVVFDLKDFLFMGMILKEKDFRQNLKELDWQAFVNKNVAVTCSADAIIPHWAFMLCATYLAPIAHMVFYGTKEEMQQEILLNNIRQIKGTDFQDKRIVIKGCGDALIPPAAYFEITRSLLPFVKSLMYGEPCSTVPVYKKK